MSVHLESRVGVLLDGLPASMRDRVAADLASRKDEFWLARAKSQTLLTKLKLAFRRLYYPDASPQKAQLPLPPDTVWTLALRGKPTRTTIDGHDVVVADYAFDSKLVTRADSPAASEPALAAVGGTWDEPFLLPVDPEQVMQRTGLACFDESGFPPNSVDPEETAAFYDQECEPQDALTPAGALIGTGCHASALPTESCVDAVKKHIGHVDAVVHFTREPWDETVASKYRFGEVKNATGADIRAGSESRIFAKPRATYRYVPADSCTIVEKCVGGSGWRRLLAFSSIAWNRGAAPLAIGEVNPDEAGKLHTDLADHNVFEFSQCHRHYHFMHYGAFSYGDQPNPNGKRGFCLESTDRLSNNEASPLHTPFDNCGVQGIEAGWADNYSAGIECQWVDVTAEDTSKGNVTKKLREHLNPDGFLCEGTPARDAAGKLTFEPTSFTTADGKPVDRPRCDFGASHEDDNDEAEDFTLKAPGETYVTEPCARGQVGPEKNCGFKKQADALKCTPGQKVALSCSVPKGAAPHALRVCEGSVALGVGMACGYGAPEVGTGVGLENVALGVGIVEDGKEATVSFTCPSKRDDIEVGGTYALFASTLVDGDALDGVTCTQK